MREAGCLREAVEQCDEIAPQQERVIRVIRGAVHHHIGAVDDQRVDAVVRRAVVEHVDERVALAGEVHGVLVGIALAVQVEHRTHTDPVRIRAPEQRVEEVVVRRSGDGQLELGEEARVVVVRGDVHVEEVVSGLAVDRGGSADTSDGDRVVALVHRRVAVTHEHIGRSGVRAVDVQAVCARTEPQIEIFSVRVVHAAKHRHLEPAQRGRRQRTGLVGRVRGVVNVDDVVPESESAIDHHQSVDRVDLAGSRGRGRRQRRRVRRGQRRRQVAQVERVVAILAVEVHLAAEARRAHVERVVVFLAVHRQHAAGTVDVDSVGALRHVDGGLA